MNYDDYDVVLEAYTGREGLKETLKESIRVNLPRDRFHHLVSASLNEDQITLTCKNGKRKVEIKGDIETQKEMGRISIGFNYPKGYKGLAPVANLQTLLADRFARTTIAHVRSQ
jgi:hypothetical protein